MVNLPQDPIPVRSINVHIPHNALFDLGKMQKITAATLGRLGCAGCHSGFDIRFLALRDFVVNPQTLDVTEHIMLGM
jgi:hypothetical protein